VDVDAPPTERSVSASTRRDDPLDLVREHAELGAATADRETRVGVGCNPRVNPDEDVERAGAGHLGLTSGIGQRPRLVRGLEADPQER
jgi:hypothetical protein